MKKMVALMLAALLALAGVPALAESSETLILTATVEGLDPIVLSAPASGCWPPSACGQDSFSPPVQRSLP